VNSLSGKPDQRSGSVQGDFGPDGGLLNVVRRFLHRRDPVELARTDSLKSSVSLRSAVFGRLERCFTQDRSTSTEVLPSAVQVSPATARVGTGDGPPDSTSEPKQTVPNDSLDMPSEFMVMVQNLERRFTQEEPTSPEVLSSDQAADQPWDAATEPEARASKDSLDAPSECMNARSVRLAARDPIAGSNSTYSTIETNPQNPAKEHERCQAAGSFAVEGASPSLPLQADAYVLRLSQELDSEKRRFDAEMPRQFEEVRASALAFFGNAQKLLAARAQSSLDSLLKAAVEKARAELDAFRQSLIEDSQEQLASMSRASLEVLTRDLIEQIRAELTASRQAFVEDTESQLAKMMQSSLQALQSQAAACVERASAQLMDAHKAFIKGPEQQLAGITQAARKSLVNTTGEQSRKELSLVLKESLASTTPQTETELRELEKEHGDGVQAQAPPARWAPRQPLRTPEHRLEITLADGVRKLRVNLPDLRLGLAWGVKLGLASGVVVLAMLAIYVYSSSVVRLRAAPPLAFFDENPRWTAKQRAREDQRARAYWDIAVRDIEKQYGFGTTLPTDPPDSFKVEEKGRFGATSKVDPVARSRYWQKLREVWARSDSWERTYGNLGRIYDH
jgi:hypothetical protein